MLQALLTWYADQCSEKGAPGAAEAIVSPLGKMQLKTPSKMSAKMPTRRSTRVRAATASEGDRAPIYALRAAEAEEGPSTLQSPDSERKRARVSQQVSRMARLRAL